MIKTIDLYDFRREFEAYNRDYYSSEGYEAMFDYYEELGDIELDVIAFCGEWTEYDTIEDIISDYSNIFDKYEDYISNYIDDGYTDDELKDIFNEGFMEELSNNTYFIELSNSYLVQAF